VLASGLALDLMLSLGAESGQLWLAKFTVTLTVVPTVMDQETASASFATIWARRSWSCPTHPISSFASEAVLA
jgi:hypothetical protein